MCELQGRSRTGAGTGTRQGTMRDGTKSRPANRDGRGRTATGVILPGGQATVERCRGLPHHVGVLIGPPRSLGKQHSIRADDRFSAPLCAAVSRGVGQEVGDVGYDVRRGARVRFCRIQFFPDRDLDGGPVVIRSRGGRCRRQERIAEIHQVVDLVDQRRVSEQARAPGCGELSMSKPTPARLPSAARACSRYNCRGH